MIIDTYSSLNVIFFYFCINCLKIDRSVSPTVNLRIQPNWKEYRLKFFCKNYKVHGYFDPTLYGNPFDIAILFLTEKFDFNKPYQLVLRPCSLAGYSSGGYNYGTAIGLGLTNQNPQEKPGVSMEATLRRDENCGQYNFPKFWFKSQLVTVFQGSLLFVMGIPAVLWCSRSMGNPFV